MACAAGQTEVAKLLIESNASVNPTILIDPLNSPLHEAVMKGWFLSDSRHSAANSIFSL